LSATSQRAYFKADVKYFLEVGEMGSGSLQQGPSNLCHQVLAGFPTECPIL